MFFSICSTDLSIDWKKEKILAFEIVSCAFCTIFENFGTLMHIFSPSQNREYWNWFHEKYFHNILGTKSAARKAAVIVIAVIQKLGRPMCIVPFTSKV